MTAWLDLFTGTTFEEFQKAGARVSGFRQNAASVVERIKPGDLLLCYVTGISRFVGILKVEGVSNDHRAIWSYDDFPARLSVQPDLLLSFENGVPLEVVEQELDDASSTHLRGLLRRSPNQIQDDLAEPILRLVRAAAKNPTKRPVDADRLGREPRFVRRMTPFGEVAEVPVEVPVADEPEFQESRSSILASEHTDVQGRLLELGNQLGLQTWVASNDRNRSWKKTTLGAVKGLIQRLPIQYDEVTNRTIELIDVLWLRRNTIVAAFEVECTTSVYSGLLRMSDLLALQPNLTMPLYVVAPEARREKVRREILRPTFQLGDRPLSSLVRFLPIERMRQELGRVEEMGLTSSLNPSFIDRFAEQFNEGAGV